MSNAPLLSDGDFTFRDLNKNGQLDPYEDPRRSIDERVEDLLSRMTLEEKAGLMFHGMTGVNPDGGLNPPNDRFAQAPIAEMVGARMINHFNVHALPAPRVAAEWYNRLQALAEGTRLGIPVTISSDPRHAFSDNPATSFMAGAFSQWPEPLGFGATGDPELVEAFGDIARQEYLAVGIRVALHPMADLATEPRWARNNGTFGEDAELSARLTAAYIRGFQGAALGPQSVACMTKHFPGGGPQKDGEDAHFPYGREQVYPGDNFDYHLIPFEAAFAAGTAQIMPYYGMPVGTPLEAVGFGFNQQVITGLLRERYGFDGVVCTDWGLLTDAEIGGAPFPARLGRRAPEPSGARPKGARRRRRSVRGRAVSRGHRRVSSERPDSRKQARPVGAPPAARQIQAGIVRRSLRRPRGRRTDRRQRGVPRGGRAGAAPIHRPVEERRHARGQDPTTPGPAKAVPRKRRARSRRRLRAGRPKRRGGGCGDPPAENAV
jgi:beta-glucosidase-like glycosyl hydrolase